MPHTIARPVPQERKSVALEYALVVTLTVCAMAGGAQQAASSTLKLWNSVSHVVGK